MQREGGVQGNVVARWSEKKMDREDGLRTVECLRGRLLAERVASRNAKEEADLTGNKLVELEAQLKQEIRSRKRAEKKLKLLMKKLESLNVLHVCDGSDQSSSLDKSEVTTVSSSASSTSNLTEDEKQIRQITDEGTPSSVGEASFRELVATKHYFQASDTATNSISTGNSEQHLSLFTVDRSHLCSGMYASRVQSEKPKELEFSGNSIGSKAHDHHSLNTSNEELRFDEDHAKGSDQCVDYSMALVPVDPPKPAPSGDPVVLDATVKEVLDSLRRVKEKIQVSMEQRSMIRVG